MLRRAPRESLGQQVNHVRLACGVVLAVLLLENYVGNVRGRHASAADLQPFRIVLRHEVIIRRILHAGFSCASSALRMSLALIKARMASSRLSSFARLNEAL